MAGSEKPVMTQRKRVVAAVLGLAVFGVGAAALASVPDPYTVPEPSGAATLSGDVPHPIDAIDSAVVSAIRIAPIKIRAVHG